LKLAVFSDVHLDHDSGIVGDWTSGGVFKTIESEGMHAIDAGDVHPHPEMREYWRSLFPAGYASVMGNHDYYGSAMPKPGDGQFLAWRNIGKSDELRIAGATLWTKMTGTDWEGYDSGLVDTRYIAGDDEPSYRSCFESDLAFIANNPTDVVVTHHSPSMRGASKRFIGSPYNKYFHNELDAFILDMKHPPTLWIHGHTHDSCDYMIGRTRVICHPRGYPGEANFDQYSPLIINL